MDASYIMNDYMDKVAMGATGVHGFDKIGKCCVLCVKLVIVKGQHCLPSFLILNGFWNIRHALFLIFTIIL